MTQGPIPPTRTAVLVVSYGSADLLRETLARSVPDSQAHRPLVIVVENDTRRAARDRIREVGATHGWQVLEAEANLGFGGGCNLAAQHALQAGCDVLVLLNPDLTLEPVGLERLAARVRQDADVVVAPTIQRPDGTAYARGRTLLRLDRGEMLSEARRDEVPAEVPVMPWLSGAALAMSADLWRRSGGFDPRYFLYWEDVDLARRLHRAGGRLEIEGSVLAVHDEGATHRTSGAGRAKSETYYYYSIRNRLLFARQWLTPTWRRRWVLLSPVTAWAVLLQGGRRQLVHSAAPWRALVRGLWDGALARTGERGSR